MNRVVPLDLAGAIKTGSLGIPVATYFFIINKITSHQIFFFVQKLTVGVDITY
jgi:hypothetical protein